MGSLEDFDVSQSHRNPERPVIFRLLNAHHTPLPANGNGIAAFDEFVLRQRELYFYPRTFHNFFISEEIYASWTHVAAHTGELATIMFCDDGSLYRESLALAAFLHHQQLTREQVSEQGLGLSRGGDNPRELRNSVALLGRKTRSATISLNCAAALSHE